MAAGNLKFPKNEGYSLSRRGRPEIRPESGTAFDATIMDDLAPVGTHERASDDTIDPAAFSTIVRRGGTKKRTGFLKKGTGLGGTLPKVTESKEAPDDLTIKSRRKGRVGGGTSKQRSTSKRSNPSNTAFRQFFERGVLPVRVEHTPTGIRAKWEGETPVADLDYHFFLPVFFSGLREVEEPFRSLSLSAIQQMVTAAPDKVRKVVPQIALPIHQALTTRDPVIIRRVLLVLQTTVKEGAEFGVGEALVPYFRQFLPILNIFKNKVESTGDGIVYAQRKQECLADLIQETLNLLEIYGGDLAFVNIRYFIPTYESAIVTA